MMQHVLDAASLGSLYALLALGIALVFGVMRLVNFAYGELIMLVGYTLLVLNGAAWPLMVGAGVVVACVVALSMERVAFRPLRNADPSTLLVSSFALSIAIQSVMTIAAGARPKGINILDGLSAPVSVLGSSVPWLDIVTLVVAVVLMVAFSLFLRRSPAGIQVRAAAEDFRMARLLGVRANRVIAGTFAASGIFAAAAAILIVAQTGSLSPAMGLGPALIAFVATVVGGLGSLYGAAIGGFALGALTVVLQTALPPDVRGYRDAFIYGAVILVLLFRPQGIAGNPALKERV